MNVQTGTQAPAQAGIEDFNGIFQERLRGIVREGLLLMFEQEVTLLCGETCRPKESVYRRAGSEMVIIQTTSGKERISKRRVPEMLPSGLGREVKLKSYSEVKRRKGLFARFHARGLKLGMARRLLLVRDGSEAIDKAVTHFWPDVVQQECLVHVERGLCGKISWKHHHEVVKRMNRLRGVQGAEAAEEAFEEFLEFVTVKNLATADSLESGKEGVLSFRRLNVTATLNATFLSTNLIENVIRNSRGMIGKVCRWNPKTDQLARWMGVELPRAQEGFRRVRGHKELGALATALGRALRACSRDRIPLSNVHQPAR